MSSCSLIYLSSIFSNRYSTRRFSTPAGGTPDKLVRAPFVIHTGSERVSTLMNTICIHCLVHSHLRDSFASVDE